MAIEHPRLLRRIEFAAVVITLIVMATAMGCLVFLTANQAARETDLQHRKTLARLAWMAFSLMSLVLLVLAWLVVRYVSYRMLQKKTRPTPTPYLDAWALAGKRFKLPPDAPETLADLGIGVDEDEDEDEDSDQDDPDRDDNPAK